MPAVRKAQAASVHGRTHRAHAGSTRALDERGHGEGEHDRETNIAEIEQRRVERQTDVLQQRVEILAVERRWEDPLERVRGEQHERQEADADPRLNAQSSRFQRQWDVRPEQRDRSTEDSKDECPKQQRTFVASPRSCDLEDQRF
ncbi:MAG: hypothetical protein AcusKO_42790 [Acuticoccus sp.]